MMNKIREWISIHIAKAPSRMVLLAILVANLAIIGVSGLVISSLAPPELEDSGFWSCVFHMTTMVLGVGGVETLIEDIGEANVAYVLCCIAALIVGMIVFTGASSAICPSSSPALSRTQTPAPAGCAYRATPSF